MAQSILTRMASEEQHAETELELRGLERRIDELIRAMGRLNDENQILRSQQEQLIVERADLIEKSEQARGRVESMITRLKSMEGNL